MIRAVIRFLRFLVSPWRRGSLTPTPVHVAPAGPESLLDETCRRAAELAALEPEQVIAEGGPLERFVRGRHAALKDELSRRTAEQVAALQGDVDAQAADELAARAAAGRARSDWERERAAEDEAAQRVAEAESAVTRLQQERDGLSLRAQGYLGGPMKWLLVILVAAASPRSSTCRWSSSTTPSRRSSSWPRRAPASSRPSTRSGSRWRTSPSTYRAARASRRSSRRDSSSRRCIVAAEYLAGELRDPVGEAAATPARSTQRTPRRASSPTPRRSSR